MSRFGVIPKRGKPNSWRLILDLSFPSESSKSDFPVVYSTVQDAIRMIVRTGKGALMAKFDIEKAYRIVPIRPLAWPTRNCTPSWFHVTSGATTGVTK